MPVVASAYRMRYEAHMLQLLLALLLLTGCMAPASTEADFA